MSQIPPSPKQRRYAGLATLVLTLGFSFSVLAVDLYGTYTAYSIPTISEIVGFILIFALWTAITFVIVVLPNIDDFTIDNPFSDLPITVIYLVVTGILLVVDATMFSSQGFTWLTTMATANQALISLIFSGLLVLLYYDQHRTQRHQVQLMRQQAEIAERRESWRETEERPRLQINKWNFHKKDEPLSVASDTDISVESLATYLTGGSTSDRVGLFTGQLSNKGETRARSLHLRVEVLIRSDHIPEGYFHLNGSFLHVQTSLVRIGRNIQDQYLKRNTISIASSETVDVISGIAIYSPGPMETPVKTLGELINRLPFPVEDVVLRTSIQYEDPIGTEHTEPIVAARLPADDLDGLAAAFESGQQVGYQGVPTVGIQASREFFEEEFADIKSSNGVVKIEYSLEDG